MTDIHIHNRRLRPHCSNQDMPFIPSYNNLSNRIWNYIKTTTRQMHHNHGIIFPTFLCTTKARRLQKIPGLARKNLDAGIKSRMVDLTRTKLYIGVKRGNKIRGMVRRLTHPLLPLMLPQMTSLLLHHPRQAPRRFAC